MDRSPLAREPRAPSPQDPKEPLGLGPGGVLAVGTRSGLRDLGPIRHLDLGTRGNLRKLGPNLGFRAQGGHQLLGPGCP
jgi:hypothetical protein